MPAPWRLLLIFVLVAIAYSTVIVGGFVGYIFATVTFHLSSPLLVGFVAVLFGLPFALYNLYMTRILARRLRLLRS